MSDAETTQDQQVPPAERTLLRRLVRIYTGSAVVFWPFTDLAMRFFVALPYLRSGLIKANDWDKAVFLATEEYPVSWMAPQVAAATGLGIELLAPLLLLLGFLTRPAAFALATLTIVSQAVYIPTTTNLMLIAILIWYVFFGPAAISVDHWWARNDRFESDWFVRNALRLGAWSRKHIAPYLLLAMRWWLGISLLALADVFEPSIGFATWLPITSFTGLPNWIAILFAALLFTGTAASPVSYILTFLIAAFMFADVHPDVTFYPVLLLGLYDARGAGPFSLDNAVERWIERKFPATASSTIDPDDWLGVLKQWKVASWQRYLDFRAKRQF
ncbi:DoxX family membrane protein [Altererythrobacter arenosus]|uniref:DoxX family membrane protein n=1 Tax=Altererythrobacter arenosus TaxID=3032592 RepID=A0ABY8FPP4_9SPHN|nr:DoxX family membrane protein [Altererythrobacter sp. CAU 1644]WFL76762.1 DoxX family membrane protein [Altererythrobacter sp. CAU 1644]